MRESDDIFYEKALKAMYDLFFCQSASKDETIRNIKALIEELEIILSSLNN